MTPNPSEWKLQAACTADPGLFFPPAGREGSRQREEREAAAKALCATCPVTGPCLDYGLGPPGEAVVVQAILGGMNEEERRNEKRRRFRRRAA